MKIAVVALLAAAAMAGHVSAQIYADFKTSSGDFTCQLYYTTAPRTVANFITLAEGTRAWLDEKTGVVSTTKPAQPFYPGLTFHRVVKQTDFAIAQAGSRTGDGTDGPGYTFPDEMKRTVPQSYKFDQPYLLAMANSGPNTNGSQFFLTGTNIPSLEGIHTVFGKVTTGTDVIDTILAVAVDDKDKPVTDITIQSITIRVVGKDATKFKPLKQALPTVSKPKFKTVDLTNGNHRLLFKQPPKSLTRIWTLTPANPDWTLVFQRYLGPSAPTLAGADVPLDGKTPPLPAPDAWLRPVTTAYTADALAPTQIPVSRISLSNDQGSFQFTFSASADPTYSYTPASSTTPQTGTIGSTQYFPDGYGTTLIMDLTGLVPVRFRMSFDTLTGTSGSTYYGRQTGSFWDGSAWTPLANGSSFTMGPIP